MRTPIVAGNWKMNLHLDEAVDLTSRVNDQLIQDPNGVQVVLFPPFPYLGRVADLLRANPSLGMGAQTVHEVAWGAHTGEVSVPMIAAMGASHVLVGHSERRTLYGETDDRVRAKVLAITSAGLRPMLCVGETLEQRRAGEAESVVVAQLSAALEKDDHLNWDHLVVAYEPVWAIGTGKTATVEDAEQMHMVIRQWISDTFGADKAEQIRIVYGGSVNTTNADELFSSPNIDGGLVGGASLQFSSFTELIESARIRSEER